jgi:hypothetical protein
MSDDIEPAPEPLEEDFSYKGPNINLSNADLGRMQLKANKSINYLVKNVQTLAEKVDSQQEVISVLKDIKKGVSIASTILGIIGTISLIVGISNWFIIHIYH